MDSSCGLSCTACIEWSDAHGSLLRRSNCSAITLNLLRDSLGELTLEMRSNKGKSLHRFHLAGVKIYDRFASQGKASLKIDKQHCTVMLSNAPVAHLEPFLRTLQAKTTSCKPASLLRERNKVSEVSPVTKSELEKARIVTQMGTPTSRKRKLPSGNSEMKLTAEQAKVIEMVRLGQNIFFTGSAGTGKSVLLKAILAILPPEATMATASTGVAACHIGGTTLHQFAGIGIGSAPLSRCLELASRPNVTASWKRIKHLVIDEISMIDGNYFDKIEAAARHVKRNDKPFGGIQLILCGDFFQLPPVSGRNEQAKFCFQGEAWSRCSLTYFELSVVHRQKDAEFVRLLNEIRIGRVTDETEKLLKETATRKIEKHGITATRLCSHVEEAESINQFQLEQLEGESRVFHARDSDETDNANLFPVPKKLELKVAAQVMLLKNLNVSSGLVNGARGVVVSFEDGLPLVKFRNGTCHSIKDEKWLSKGANGVVHTRRQLPLKLAWAFSIHKSQGLTLDCVEMSLSRVFDSGQAYVALSRAQNLQTLRVLDFDRKQVWASTDVLRFYRSFRKQLNARAEAVALGPKTKRSKKEELIWHR